MEVQFGVFDISSIFCVSAEFRIWVNCYVSVYILYKGVNGTIQNATDG